VWWLAWKERPNFAMLAAGIGIVLGVWYLKRTAAAELDQRVSVRGFWRAHQAEAVGACIDGVRREWEYGLNYYSSHALPVCATDASPRIREENGRLVIAPR
jgi:hypothetical protein